MNQKFSGTIEYSIVIELCIDAFEMVKFVHVIFQIPVLLFLYSLEYLPVYTFTPRKSFTKKLQTILVYVK